MPPFALQKDQASMVALDSIEASPDITLYRKELWYDMKKTLREGIYHDAVPLRELVWKVRDTGLRLGRKVPHRTVA